MENFLSQNWWILLLFILYVGKQLARRTKITWDDKVFDFLWDTVTGFIKYIFSFKILKKTKKSS